MTRILLIGGSPTHPCKAHYLLDYAKYLLEAQSQTINIKVTTLLVRDLLAEDLAFGRYASPALIYPKKMIEDAEALIIASPISKAAYTGLLKSFLDLLPRGILSQKVILPLSTSYTIAHSLALEYSLKPVLAELGATQILTSIFAIDDQLQPNKNSGLTADIELNIRLQAGLNNLVDAIATNSAISNKSGHKVNPVLSQQPTLQEVYAT